MSVTTTEDQNRTYKEIVTSKRNTRYLFDCGYAQRYDPLLLDDNPGQRQYFRQLFDTYLPGKVSSVLDIGCGSAFYFPLLNDRADRLVGLDASPDMLREAARVVERDCGQHVSLAQGVAGNLDFPDQSFDVVLGLDLLHHVPDVAQAVYEIHRVLAPGGFYLGLEPNVLNPLIFVAHLIPRHERGALRRNTSFWYKRAFRDRFDIDIVYTNHVVSAGWGAVMPRMVALADRGLLASPLRHLSMRMIMWARKLA